MSQKFYNILSFLDESKVLQYFEFFWMSQKFYNILSFFG